MRGPETGPFQSTSPTEFRGAFSRINGRKLDLVRAGLWPTNEGYHYEATHYLTKDRKISITRLRIPPNGYLPPQVLMAEGKNVFDYIAKGGGQVIYQEKDLSPKAHGRFHMAKYPSEHLPSNIRVALSYGSRFAWSATDEGLEILRVASPPLEEGDIAEVELSKYDSTKDPFKAGFRRIATRINNDAIPDYYDTDYYARALKEALKKPTVEEPSEREIRQIEEVKLEEDSVLEDLI